MREAPSLNVKRETVYVNSKAKMMNSKELNAKWPRLMQSKWMMVLPWLLFFPALFSGFVADDYLHRMIFTQSLMDTSPILSMFAFFPDYPEVRSEQIELGIIQWWQAPETIIHFLRPLLRRARVVRGAAQGLDCLNHFTTGAILMKTAVFLQ